MTAPKVAYYSVRTTFAGALAGGSVMYYQGEVVDADDPALSIWPEHFEPLIVKSHLALPGKTRKVEAATAAPGEKRA